MSLKNFSLICPQISPIEVLTALKTAIPTGMIESAITKTGSRESRQWSLPTALIVCFVIAMSLWSSDSMRDVLKNLVDGLSKWRLKLNERSLIPSKAAITKARQRVGPRVMSELFNQLTCPMATPETLGAFLGGLRVVVIDGTSFDIPDTEENARVFGYPATRPSNRAAFPKARLVLLIEVGTHVIFDALLCPYRQGERGKAKKLLRSVDSGMLLMWDRGLHSYQMIHATETKNCAYLGRVPAHVRLKVEQQLPDGSYLSHIYPNRQLKQQGCQPIPVRVTEYTLIDPDRPDQIQIYRLITNLFNIEQFPAELLAQEYHQRWEAENAIDEIKTHLIGRKTPIRSQTPREVVQEIYGWLLGHHALRSLMFQAAQQADISPLRLSFTGTLKVVRRAVPKFQQVEPANLARFFDALIADILDQQLPSRSHRSNPRLVKKPISKFPSKKPVHRGNTSKRSPPVFRILDTA